MICHRWYVWRGRYSKMWWATPILGEILAHSGEYRFPTWREAYDYAYRKAGAS